MVEAGDSADHAQAMYDQSVTTVVIAAVVLAAVASVVLAVILARMLARPLAEVGGGGPPHRRGRLRRARPARGSRGAGQPRRFVQPDGGQPRAAGGDAARLHRQRRARAADAADQPAGLPRGVARRRHHRRPVDLRVARGTRPSGSSGCRARSMRWPRATPRRRRARSSSSTCRRRSAPRSTSRNRPSTGRSSGSWSTCPEHLPARANPDALAQVLGNLISNAARYTPVGGTVTVRAERRPADLLVSIANTGEGIPPEDIDRVFERFYRVEKSRDRAHGGAGIGLAIVKQLVEAGGGRVGAESGDGTTRFWFSLPA